MVPEMDSYLALLAVTATGLPAEADPDGWAARQALLLAAHAGTAHTGAPGADWDLYTVAVTDAAQHLQADLDEPVVLLDELPAAGPDEAGLRREVTALVRRLADLYAVAAAGETGSAWRRLVWARVAHRLDDAVAELT
jgi:hypothetical protein